MNGEDQTPTSIKRQDIATFTEKWHQFFNQYQKDLILWLFCVLSLSIYRIVFLYYFRNQIDPTISPPDIVWIFFEGFRYDAITASLLVSIPFLLSAACGFTDISVRADRFRRSLGELYCALYSGVCIITINYFREFKTQMNHFVVKLFHDDTMAIVQTLWSDYHLGENFVLIAAVTAVMVVLVRRLLTPPLINPELLKRRRIGISTQVLISLATACMILFSMYDFGYTFTVVESPSVARDDFMKQVARNPFLAVYDTARDFVRENNGAAFDELLPDHDVRRVAQAVFKNSQHHDDLDDYLIKYASGALHPPRHLFLIVMESFDAWPLMDEYAPLHLADNLKLFVQQGISVQHFLPSGNGSSESFFAILTGLPYVTVDMLTSIRTYPTALAAQFKRLGYKTNLFYGGNSNWLNLDNMGRIHGFNEVYGSEHMADESLMNVWKKVPDETLFHFIVKTVDDSHPSFNVVMTTSYHPPYTIDVYERGFPLKSIPEGLFPDADKNLDLKELGHLWYSDQCLGAFVHEEEKLLPGTLFAITGDHYSRRFITARPNFYEKSAVPFVLYGKNVLRGIHFPKDVAGSHLDIGPTLIELSAPKGFRYYSVGSSLLTETHDHIGIGWHQVIGPDFIIDLSSLAQIHPLPNRSLPNPLPKISEMRLLLNRVYAVGWWRVNRGSRLE